MRFKIRQVCLPLWAPILAILVLGAAHSSTTQTNPELRRLLQEAINSDAGFNDRFHAEVWLMDMSGRLEPFIPDPESRITLLKQLHYEATRVNLPPELVLAVIEVESGFDQYAISVSGARGLMQIMPFWLDEIAISDKNLFRVRTNLRMGCTIIESNDLTRALARYNGSLGKPDYPNKIIAALNERWFRQ